MCHVARRGCRHSSGVSEDGTMLGVSASLLDSDWDWPVHGLRHPPKAGTSGWYIWTGELSGDSDFFQSLHAEHLVKRCPEVAKFLDLPPGTRFLVGPGQEDVWTDESLLDV